MRALCLISLLFLLPANAWGQASKPVEKPPEKAKPLGPGFLVCYPNAPGSTRAARPVMGRLGEYLGERLKRNVNPVYFNEVPPALTWTKDKRPRYAILSLALYLRWQKQLGLSSVAQTERRGKSTERFYLLVRKDSPHTSLADLAKAKTPPRIWSNHLDEARFATNVVFDGKLVVKEIQHKKAVAPAFAAGTVRVVSSNRPISALRRLKKNAPYKGQPVDAVLVDSTAWSGLQQLQMFQGSLRVLYTSPAVPTPPVLTLKGVAADERKRFEAVLTGMRDETEGKAILKTLQLTGFTGPDAKGLAAAAAAYARKVGS